MEVGRGRAPGLTFINPTIISTASGYNTRLGYWTHYVQLVGVGENSGNWWIKIPHPSVKM